MKHLDLFSGIGGFSYGFSLANVGIETIAHCEIDEYCQKLLKQKYPNTTLYTDVREIGKGGGIDKVDIITAGFPCQDLSIAGNKAGLVGERSGLFYETIRIAKQTNPKFILYENSPELIRRDSYREAFVKELQAIGYDMWWQLLCASYFGLPHKRERAYVLCWQSSGDTDSKRQLCFDSFQYHYSKQNTQRPSKEVISLCSEYRRQQSTRDYEVDCIDIRGDDGFPTMLHRVKALGNSIIPAIATIYAKTIYDIKEK